MFGIGLPEIIIIILSFIPGIIGALIAKNKGRNVFGWFVFCGILWIPIFFLIFLPPAKEVEGKYRECPACKEIVKWGAIICKHCGSPIKQ